MGWTGELAQTPACFLPFHKDVRSTAERSASVGPHPEGNLPSAGWFFNQRLPALRQFRKEKPGPSPRLPRFQNLT